MEYGANRFRNQSFHTGFNRVGMVSLLTYIKGSSAKALLFLFVNKSIAKSPDMCYNIGIENGG